MNYLEYNLTNPVSSAEDALRDFATGGDFWNQMETAFGNGIDFQKAAALAADWQAGDFSGLPEIEIRPSAEINGAMGAFSTDTNTIYFSQEFLSANAGNSGAVAGVWLEEIGHFVDSVVNDVDAAGDEGDIFSRLVRGDVLNGLELGLLRSEDDGAVVVLDGVEVAIEMATRLSGDGATVEDEIESAGDEDEFTFTGKKGDIVTLGIDNRTDGGLKLTLLNPDGSELDSTFFETTFEPELQRIELPANGTYTAVVDGEDSNTGKYILALSNLGEEGATRLSGDGATAPGTIDYIFDEDVFTFKGQAGDIVTLGADNSTSGILNLTLLNPDGSDLDFSTSVVDFEISRVALPSGGTYTVIVDGFDSRTRGNYVLGLSNLGQDSATPLEDGITLNGAIEFIFDEDIFTFKGKAGDVVTLALESESGLFGLTLLNSDGSELTSDFDFDPVISQFRLFRDDTYTLIVDGNGSDVQGYTLSASGLSSQDPTGTNKKDNLEGTSSNNKINGKGGNDKISGGGGNDRLDGGQGNDNLNGGTGKDRLSGGSGNDKLDGGRGADILNGGRGNDTYIIDNPQDKIQEKGNGGTDTIRTSINININVINNVENIVFTGRKSLNGTGNRGKNEIEGNRGRNRIDGQAGNDIINGGGGNDNLLGGEGNDIVNGGSGNDVVNGDIGNDTLTGGSGKDTLIGDAGKDELAGGGGSDRLTGGAGNDILTGGGGKDRFIFNSDRRFRKKDFGTDQIADFVLGKDKIVLDLTTFNSLESKAGNSLVNNDFATITGNASAAKSSAEIVYNSTTGELFYNANGSQAGFGGGGKFATLVDDPALSRTDFMVQN